MTFPPLQIDTDHWRSRWLHLGKNFDIHRVAQIEWKDGEMIYGQGTTVCGRTGYLHMPGIFSRLGADRCPKCCIALNIPLGEGAPFNADIVEKYHMVERMKVSNRRRRPRTQPRLADVSDAFQQFHTEMLRVFRYEQCDQGAGANAAQEKLFDKLREMGLAEHIDWEDHNDT